MLVHIKTILKKADAEGYAVGAFNTQNLELTLAIARAAVAQRAPIIIQISETTIKYAGLKPITHIVETIAKNNTGEVPIALHLDHGKSFLVVAECIKAGFSSIHIDGSELPYDENVILTKESVAYAHKHGVWAQGELGTILGKEGLLRRKKKQIKPEEYMTDPNKAGEFVKQTKVDTFAMSIGNMHGMFVGSEKLDLKRLEEIDKKVRQPLVLHGGSGVSVRDIKQAVRYGIRVINIDTELRVAFTSAACGAAKKDPNIVDPRRLLSPAMDAVQKVVEQKIKLFGSANKA
ncbi:hypothetical protein A2477_01340 [Candidatus Falkowbacteria bacterium RIFOXYC2_FULL_47_12]|uniref:Tagatose-bisphosphate aldolase n=1 Tax=Candidatus Falkowbacteria bacterium RIFOXYC2_FULL_47_12 TaxID=1798004 RepID=A0A1F5TR58_9BACT|nr:MAG: hypothetical protein A2477_01340 [Candidatus Falkowbacteria bacterium RIFOXYC2_FULL_47_12]